MKFICPAMKRMTKAKPGSKRPRGPRPYLQQALDLEAMRKLPFWMLAFLTILVAYRAPYGRRPAEFDWDMSWEAIEWSLYKPLHIVVCALLMVLGVLAYKWKRWWLAALLTMIVGFCWEVAQTTVAGHNPRLADLVPDFLGVVLGWLIVEGIRHAMKPEDYLFG
jgi:VanZ family protein